MRKKYHIIVQRRVQKDLSLFKIFVLKSSTLLRSFLFSGTLFIKYNHRTSLKGKSCWFTCVSTIFTKWSQIHIIHPPHFHTVFLDFVRSDHLINHWIAALASVCFLNFLYSYLSFSVLKWLTWPSMSWTEKCCLEKHLI